MTKRIQNNTNTPSFGMSYSLTNSAKKMHWATELEKNKKQLTSDSQNVIAIFTKGLVGNLDCYAFKPSKYDIINKLQEKFPAATLNTRRFVIFSKEYFFDKYSDFGHNGTLWLKDKSVTNLLKKAKEDLIRRTKINAE